MRWVTVFDLSRDGWLHLWPLAAMLAIMTVSIALAVRDWLASRRLTALERKERRLPGPITISIVRAVVGVVTFILAAGTVWSVANLVSLLGIEQHKTYHTIEGAVRDFRTSDKRESFDLKGVKFDYSDYDLSPCFHNTATHGGPLREGLRVRIEYARDAVFGRNGIIRLDILEPRRTRS